MGSLFMFISALKHEAGLSLLRAVRKEIWEETRQTRKGVWTRELLRELLGMERNLKYTEKIQQL